MAKAKRLPSGMWNVTVYSHTENGKRKYESFTALTKNEAELKAAEFKANKTRRIQNDLTVAEAIDKYITAREGVLSPSTIREYRRMAASYYCDIGSQRIRKITTETLQLWISDMSHKVSSKTVHNAYGLLSSSLTFFQPNTIYRVKLPPKGKRRPESPSDDAVMKLLAEAPPKLKICIQLGIRGLRAGEISALKYEDISDGIAHIHADFVKDSTGAWVYKEIPKTADSDRYVKVPDLGSGTGFIVSYMPATISKRFIELKKKLRIEGIRFHDLRHYFASTAAVLNIPDIYTADMGGWARGSNSQVMKSVYQNNIKSMSDYYMNKMEEYLTDLEENAKRDAK